MLATTVRAQKRNKDHNLSCDNSLNYHFIPAVEKLTGMLSIQFEGETVAKKAFAINVSRQDLADRLSLLRKR